MRHSLPYRMLRKRPMKLSTTVILMVSAVLFSVLLVVHLIYFSQISDMTRDGLANKALAVARTLADSPEIRQGLQKKTAGEWNPGHRGSRAQTQRSAVYCRYRYAKPSLLAS